MKGNYLNTGLVLTTKMFKRFIIKLLNSFKKMTLKVRLCLKLSGFSELLKIIINITVPYDIQLYIEDQWQSFKYFNRRLQYLIIQLSTFYFLAFITLYLMIGAVIVILVENTPYYTITVFFLIVVTLFFCYYILYYKLVSLILKRLKVNNSKKNYKK